MNDRDRLIELINHKQDYGVTYTKSQMDDRKVCANETPNSVIADYILADGWIRLPCKVGDTVYCIEYNLMLVDEYTVDGYTFKNSKLALYVRSGIYSTVVSEWYLTKEEAERALKEREG